jgi:Carboxypeptidase regulatory-like domain
MKFFAVFCVTVVTLAAQQTVDPALNTHPKDNATFGNEKAPKKEKAPTSRTVSGQVTDETGQVLQGAMVTLVDKKTNEKTNFFTKKDGRYQFADLSFTRDYEVQARYKDKASASRKLSQFDTSPRPVRILEIDTGGAAATSASPAAASNSKPQPR